MAVTRSTCITAVVIACLIIGVGVGLGVWFLKPSDSTNHSGITENPVSTTEASEPRGWPVDFSTGLIIRTDYDIQALNYIDGTTVKLIQQAFVNVVDYYKNETLYYAGPDAFSPVISQSKSFPDLKFPGDNWFVNALAVDYLTGKVYAYDQHAKKIDCFDIQGKYMGIILSDLDMVKDIVLDTLWGYMFILQSTGILKAGMDGEGLEAIVKDTGISTLAIDVYPKKLYWSKGNKITVHDYFYEHKSSQAAIIKGATSIPSLSVLRQSLYFVSRQPNGTLSLFSCAIQSASKGECTNIISHPFRDNPHQLKSFDIFESDTNGNPCKYANGGCEQLCVLSDRAQNFWSYTCQCQLGWQLNYDKKTCSPVDEYVMYVRGKNVRGHIKDLMKQSFVDTILPQSLIVDSVQDRKVVDFDYNAHKGYLVFADDHDLWRVDMQRNKQQNLVEEALQYTMYPAIDWVADQLYYLRTHFNGVNASQLVVRSAASYGNFDSQKTIHTFSKTQRPRALVVIPNLGYLFFTVYDESSKQASIYRINSDGSGLMVLEVNDVNFSVNEIGLGFDYSLNRLYWFNKERTQIQHATLTGLDLRIIDIWLVKNPVSISIHHQWMYVGNGAGIWNFRKDTGEYARRVLSKVGENEQETISAAKGFGVSLQLISDDHPCAIENGGCGTYCFGVPSESTGKLIKVCACSDDQKLQEDAKTCVSVPQSE